MRLALIMMLAPTVALALDVSWQPTVPRPGDAVLVTVAVPGGPEPKGKLGENALTFWRSEKAWHALTGLSVDLAPGPVPLQLDVGGALTESVVTIEAANWRERELTVAKKFTQPSKEEKRRTKADQAAFKKAFDRPFIPLLASDGFKSPRDAVVTAPFGDRRMLNGKMSSQHYGYDLDGKVGAPVFASADGRVVLVRDCFSSGRSVLVDHGAGTTSVYFHLHRVRVKLGQRVKRGARLGDVGKSGRVTGPHLHFGVKIEGNYVDPERLFAITWPSPLPAPETAPAAPLKPTKRKANK